MQSRAPDLKAAESLMRTRLCAIPLETYRQTLLNLYLRLPDTPCRVSSHEGRLVQQLWERRIPLTTVETAFLLASVRRAALTPSPSQRSARCSISYP